ncbi:MAG: hypothetical protein BGO55_11265 [Sphingobacteriales bacterium 50-39]|nr:DUF3347 domain-containing protein [Sphingobacteriales bacterium]OJW54276.1 MAG: hypothetical protein BGO55_11265 [Sphingobacteriales bacterium 50-39]
MKKIFMAVVVLIAVSSQHLFAQVSNILPSYYGVKDALVAGDANAAAARAGELLKAIDGVDMSKMPGKDHTAFMAVKDKLAFDARHISEKKEIGHQREHFASLSTNMMTLAKDVKLSEQAIYEDYCPMKKATWLTNDQTIKNPYYGSSMLTCGKIKSTLKP